MAPGDIRYSTLPRQEAPDTTPTPPPPSLASQSPLLSPTITLTEDLGFLPPTPPLSPSSSSSSSSSLSTYHTTAKTTQSSECSISTAELFPGLRRERLLLCGFTDEQNSSIRNLLAVVDDVQRRLRTAYAKERETGGYFQPDAHRQIIREHKIGDWMVVRLGYWEALVAIRGVLGDSGHDGNESDHGNGHEGGNGNNGNDGHGDRDENGGEMGNNGSEDETEDEDGNENIDMDREREREKEREIERGQDRDKRYDRVVATLKDFIKMLTTLKDKALKDKMQVNKQRYTHTGQWLNFLTIGAGVLIYIKNIFLAAPAAMVGVMGAGANATVYGGEI
ncbi:hypothetical protein F4825DRAFT_417845 [Nemania diffusa]|nr:hypothetical protein F4825DRAFT_417845 [Nemania diffusa]